MWAFSQKNFVNRTKGWICAGDVSTLSGVAASEPWTWKPIDGKEIGADNSGHAKPQAVGVCDFLADSHRERGTDASGAATAISKLS